MISSNIISQTIFTSYSIQHFIKYILLKTLLQHAEILKNTCEGVSYSATLSELIHMFLLRIIAIRSHVSLGMDIID